MIRNHFNEYVGLQVLFEYHDTMAVLNRMGVPSYIERKKYDDDNTFWMYYSFIGTDDALADYDSFSIQFMSIDTEEGHITQAVRLAHVGPNPGDITKYHSFDEFVAKFEEIKSRPNSMRERSNIVRSLKELSYML